MLLEIKEVVYLQWGELTGRRLKEGFGDNAYVLFLDLGASYVGNPILWKLIQLCK